MVVWTTFPWLIPAHLGIFMQVYSTKLKPLEIFTDQKLYSNLTLTVIWWGYLSWQSTWHIFQVKNLFLTKQVCRTEYQHNTTVFSRSSFNLSYMIFISSPVMFVSNTNGTLLKIHYRSLMLIINSNGHKMDPCAIHTGFNGNNCHILDFVC